MDVRGWVYVISNEAMPGLLKVGFSTKDPHLRAQELGNSGAPHPYTVSFDVLVRAPRDTEQRIHKELRAKREGKEWFRCTLREAVDAVRKVSAGSVIAEHMSKECETSLAKEAYGSAQAQGIPGRFVSPTNAKWSLSQSSGLLTHKRSGRTLSAKQYYFDGGGSINGLVVRDSETPWIHLDDVEFVA